jgi:hypothetical protein
MQLSAWEAAKFRSVAAPIGNKRLGPYQGEPLNAAQNRCVVYERRVEVE